MCRCAFSCGHATAGYKFNLDPTFDLSVTKEGRRTSPPRSVSNLERRAVLRPRPAVIVDARSGDVRVTKPFLHLGDVGLVIERIGGGRRAQRMSADLEPELRRVGPHQPVNAVCRDRPFEPAGAMTIALSSGGLPEQHANAIPACCPKVFPVPVCILNSDNF
jgi:hypothetical protein